MRDQENKICRGANGCPNKSKTTKKNPKEDSIRKSVDYSICYPFFLLHDMIWDDWYLQTCTISYLWLYPHPFIVISAWCPCRSVVRPGRFLQRLLPHDIRNEDEPHPTRQRGWKHPLWRNRQRWVSHSTHFWKTWIAPPVSFPHDTKGAFRPGPFRFAPTQMICSESVCIFSCFVFTMHNCKSGQNTHPRKAFLRPWCHCLRQMSCWLT